MIETEKKIRELEASQEVAQPEENLGQQLIEQKENYDKAYEEFMKLKNNMIVSIIFQIVDCLDKKMYFYLFGVSISETGWTLENS